MRVLDGSEHVVEAGGLESAREHLDALDAELVLVEREAVATQPRLAHKRLGHSLRSRPMYLVAAQIQLLELSVRALERFGHRNGAGVLEKAIREIEHTQRLHFRQELHNNAMF